MRGDLYGTREAAQKARLQGNRSFDHQQAQTWHVLGNISACVSRRPGVGRCLLRRSLMRGGASCQKSQKDSSLLAAWLSLPFGFSSFCRFYIHGQKPHMAINGPLMPKSNPTASA